MNKLKLKGYHAITQHCGEWDLECGDGLIVSNYNGVIEPTH